MKKGITFLFCRLYVKLHEAVNGNVCSGDEPSEKKNGRIVLLSIIYTRMDDFQFTAPTKKEIEENKSAGSEPLQGEDYIAKIGKVRLEKKAGWSNGVMNPNIQQLMYSLILLPYKLKAEDGMIDIAGNKVEPLTQRLFKDVNP